MEQPGPKPVDTAVPPQPPQMTAANGHAEPHNLQKAAAGLIEAGLAFLESLTTVAPSKRSGEGANGSASILPVTSNTGRRQETPGGSISEALSGLFSRDVRTNEPILAIPLPPSVTESRVAQALGGLLSRLQG